MAQKRLDKRVSPVIAIEQVRELSSADMHDLCDATDASINDGGGFGWVDLPPREKLEDYWRGVMAMPKRLLFVARLDGVVCGTAQLIKPSRNNEATRFAVTLTTSFVAPWARQYGLAKMLLEEVERVALAEGFGVINLEVRETQKAAISLFERLGYECAGHHPYYACVKGQIVPGRSYYKLINPSFCGQSGG